ncbi:hypothetical protein F5890DRAFT_928038 [Lentinula detonsa]|uniref:F-box domain-containing protein n=1 Tax=Lentinula detonsa TaxID=2804962 RepID=A0AA38UUD3_9AGAR|nr:hypothetical protein F5890DRAFT_928038 [Lentinula detonsa]
MANNISTLDEISRLQLDERLKIRACGIGNLPTEILALIFSTVHSQSLLSSTTKFTTSDAVLRLSHVNSIWRETCISFSRLWSHIHIIRASSNEAERIQLFLERSGTSSLIIDFYAPEGVDLYHPETIGMIQKLFDACGRWKEVSFSAEAQSLEQVAMILSGDNNLPQLAQRFNFPLLEKLAFIQPLESQNRPFLDIFQQKSTPKLRILVIPSYTTFLPFAFDQITSLQLLKTNSVLLPRICTQLVELGIGQTFGESNELIPPLSAAAFELPKVETLTVSLSGSGRLWNMLTLPSLRNFILEAITFMPLEYIAVLNMLRRSGCGPSLRRLDLAGMDAQAVDVESMLGLMPQLEELVLKETLMRQQKILTPRLLTTLRLPNSQYLSVTNTSAISPATSSDFTSTISQNLDSISSSTCCYLELLIPVDLHSLL